MRGQIVGAEAGQNAHVVRNQSLAADQLGQVLQAGRDIDRVADHRELRVALIADVARDDQAAVNPDAEADRIVRPGDERRVQPFDVGGDGGACRDRLPAASAGRPRRPKSASSPSPRIWLGSPPELITARLTALRNWLMMNTVS